MYNQQEFPVIGQLNDMKSVLGHKDEIRFMEQSNGTTVCCYLISSENTFDSAMALEARGAVFAPNGSIIGRPLHKFFNLNERPSSRYETVDWTSVVRVMDKRDGSMIQTVIAGGDTGVEELMDGCGFALKSKKSFTSDVAIQAGQFIINDTLSSAGVPRKYLSLCSDMAKHKCTAIFEWTSPTARIVLAYPQDELKLLHIRDNCTGEYFTYDKITSICHHYNIPAVTSVPGGYVGHAAFDDIMTAIANNKVQEYLDVVEGVEGWVIQFANGNMIKIKTKWYLERHRAMTFLRVRDIVKLVLSESLDDLKGLLVSEGADIAEILEIESGVVGEINYIRSRVDASYEANKDKDRKDFAVTMKGHPYFGLLMTKYTGKEVDYLDWFTKNKLQDYGLRQINILQSVAEAE